uniref:Unannotated protein n=1 Tax=freshwater metagenome TaxID=449393 RepID=A0A6J5ZRA5_9ZZZZ
MQVGTDPWQVVEQRDSDFGEVIGGTDPRTHQDLRRADCSGTDDHFTARAERPLATATVAEGDARGTVAVKFDPQNGGSGHHLKVCAVLDRLQVSVGGAPAAPAALRHLNLGNAVLLGAVVVVDKRNPDGFGAGDEVARDCPGRAGVLDPQRPAGGVVLRFSAGVVLGAHEVRLNVVPTPAGTALSFPEVIVERTAPDVEHRVHRA